MYRAAERATHAFDNVDSSKDAVGLRHIEGYSSYNTNIFQMHVTLLVICIFISRYLCQTADLEQYYPI